MTRHESGGGRRPPALVGVDDDATLFKRCKAGDGRAREELIRRHLPLAHRLAGRYRHTQELREDLEQVAGLALVKALDRYDLDQGAFARYAVPSILGELKRHFRDRSWTMHIPRSLKENHLKVNEAIDRLSTETGRVPTPRQVAEDTGMELEGVLEAIEAGNAFSPTTLDAPTSTGDEDGRTIGETVGAEDPSYELVELSQTVSPAFRELPERERQILRLRFVDDLTQSEIAERVGISQMHVSRLIRRSLEAIRRHSEENVA